ncbi:unnamed protein product [Phytophthora fragariaefolia]|uniref:Unnamed protein product n=1 Tax=Phytophthora fragariaefolia TaxID=1490495 RepID=A0A9W6WY98_9STRA|nr:unnamed protein product [Phytophthora fragariaefolia]
MHKDPVMKIVRPKPIGELQGPVKAPREASDMLNAVKILMRMLKDAGIVLGSFDANELFDMEQSAIMETTLNLFARLASIVGSVVPVPQEASTPTRSQAGSSQYASATSEAGSGSDSSVELQRMTLGPSGEPCSDHGRKRQRQTRRQEKQQASSNLPAAAREPADPKLSGSQDVDMKSVGSAHSHLSEYDLDDLNVDVPARAAVAATDSSGAGTVSATRIRVSAISDLKEFSRKDRDEDRARSWFSKVKSAFVRDQAPDSEKCIVFGDLLTGPARNWYRQLSRSTRSDWKGLAKSFQIPYCGRGVSVARQYYHARKRSDESPLEYLYRLNVAGLRAQLSIKDGSTEARREHVDHFIETLEDRDLANQLALLRIPDADTLEETLRSQERAKARQGKTVYGSIRPKPKAPAGAAPSANTPVPSAHREGVKLDRSPVWNPVRAERSKFCVYAYVEKQSKSDVRKLIRPIDNTRGIHDERTMAISTLHQVDELGRSEVTMALNLLHGESRGYLKYHVPDKKFRQAKATGKINNEKATLLFDSGAEVSLLDAAFARKVGCYIDNSQELECEGVGQNPCMANGRTRVKLTLAGSLVYYFDVWVGPPTGGQELVLGMDFMTPLKILRRDAEDAKPIGAQVSVAYPDEAKPDPRSGLVGRVGGLDRTIASNPVSDASEDPHKVRPDHEKAASQLNTPPIATQDDTSDEGVCYHEGGDLFAEDVKNRWRSCRK